MNFKIDLSKRHYEIITLIFLSVSVLVIRILPLGHADIYGDGALISFRSFGWFDWLLNSGQKTPFDWLGYVPSWGYLSFHDAPPLAFLAQYIIFGLIGTGVIAARLPFVFAGIGVIGLILTQVKKIAGIRVASISAILYSFMSYTIWSEHSIYLEGLGQFFIVGSVLWGALFMFMGQKDKHLYLWSIFASCALMTKYTSVFLLPPILFYLYLQRKMVYEKMKAFVWSAAIFTAILLPVIVYNINMYSLRGHFDAALSSMLGMHPGDFSVISGRSMSFDIPQNIISIADVLMRNISYPLLILFAVCLFAVLWRVLAKGLSSFEAWISVNLAFFFLMFSLIRPADRFMSVVSPLIAVVIGIGTTILIRSISANYLRIAFAGTVASVFIIEFLYSLNTNVFKDPKGESGWSYSVNKIHNLGFNELENYMRRNIITGFPERSTIRNKSDTVFTDEDIKGRSVVVYDDRLLWTAQIWYMNRYYLYYRWPVISTSFLRELNNNSISLADLIRVSEKPAYFVYPIDSAVIDKLRNEDESLSSDGLVMSREFDKLSLPYVIIENSHGVPVFKIFTVSLSLP